MGNIHLFLVSRSRTIPWPVHSRMHELKPLPIARDLFIIFISPVRSNTFMQFQITPRSEEFGDALDVLRPIVDSSGHEPTIYVVCRAWLQSWVFANQVVNVSFDEGDIAGLVIDLDVGKVDAVNSGIRKLLG
ncbi:hypothetical protein AC578_3402 [Pseudocercospora eumusae]|uniref:Uncharacterized protein n=1 Tax=Pseudocercospora eumusae TaxID=321146 RepID=A0A139H651_9PEZI|nr:hypothetical protein AC578_3402 [Pseudocercospora eumusae]